MVAKRRSRSSRMTALLSFTSNAANKIRDRKSTRLNSSQIIPYTTLFRSIFCRQFPTTTKQKENAGRDTCAPHAGCVRSSERKSMSRELIVSVNGREKKIAIVENDRVTEFYIERGEQNQGIVGNIYKGRVIRVLPGMQSAFVDIGLERDAFLYVTDFFDEEAEFERIVVDKSKKVDTEAATRAATEHIEQARIDREQHIEATHERVEPLLEVEPAIAEEKVEPTEEAEPRRRGRRGGRG